MLNLKIGDKNQEGTIEIINEDRLCYIVKSTSRGAVGIRTISKALLEEFVAYEKSHPSSNANEMRDALTGKTEVDKFEYGYASTLLAMAKLNKIVPQRHSATMEESDFNIKAKQIVFYGAPGTGKSHEINNITRGMSKENVFRTTFHPDSDYSTFVGCYKPTKKKVHALPKPIVDYSTLVDILRQRINVPAANITKECVTFGYEYHDSIVKMQENNAHTIPSLVVDAYKSGSTYDTQVRAGMAVFESFGNSISSNDSITYSFVPQVFLKAYIRAYETTEPVVLVIEEINRGNCAQIFGDLFQLLDRDEEGFSEYPIKADDDICEYLKTVFSADSKAIANDELKLPNNLYIWATMNTSDQSLFPIDSAFKRRWDWKYMPIGKGYDANGQEIKWAIEGLTKKFDWWSFLEKINAQIGEATQSEDKKLGFFFCKATNGTISAEKFVGKVIFYLWNDVFRNNGFEGPVFKDVDGTELSFSKFYKSDSKGNAIVQKDKVELFLTNLGVEIVEEVYDEEYEDGEGYEDEGARVSDTNAPYRVIFSDGEIICEGSGWETYVASLQKIGLEKALPFGEMYSRLNKTLPLITKKKIADQGVYKYYEVEGYYVLSGTDSQHRLLKRMNKDLNLGLTIE